MSFHHRALSDTRTSGAASYRDRTERRPRARGQGTARVAFFWLQKSCVIMEHNRAEMPLVLSTLTWIGGRPLRKGLHAGACERVDRRRAYPRVVVCATRRSVPSVALNNTSA